MAEVLLLILGAFAIVFLAKHGSELGSASVLAWRVAEKGERAGEPVVVKQLKYRSHKDLDDERHRGPMLGLGLFFVLTAAGFFSLVAYVVHLPRPG
jgi:sulfite reductase alpha subunit-like flavoprotein